VNNYNVFKLLLLAVLAFSACKKTESTDPEKAQDEYKLVWADEFDNNGQPDAANWNFELGFVRNEELQWYQPDNAYCEGGNLIIEAKREQKANPNYIAGSDNWKTNREYAHYTSSSLHTRGLHSWMFGRFEMRAKIDARAGLWPAFWTLGISGSWPHNGEVDIMEYYQDKLLANIAWGAEQQWQAVWDSFSLPVAALIQHDPEWSDKFHIWSMDWDERSIKLALDGTVLNTANLSDTVNRDTEGKNPFLQPHYIIVNLAIGGTAGGDPSRTTFPAFYHIDYIRIYQK
jgi:beta-glucanase (GH16 family)